MSATAPADDLLLRSLCGEWDAATAGLFGNKSANLMRLRGGGFPIPPGICLSSAARAVEAFDGSELLEMLEQIPHPWAVRSSGLAEDSASRAFPGLFNTVLGIDTRPGVKKALQTVSLTPRTELLQSYAPGHPVPRRVPALVQTIFEPHAGGVLFTSNPISGTDSLLINSVWGLGNGVVDGTVDPDQFEVTRSGHLVSSLIAVKDVAVNSNGKPVELSREESTAASLDPAGIAALTRLAIEVERFMKIPQDIEWIQDQQGLFWVVQSRPITTL